MLQITKRGIIMKNMKKTLTLMLLFLLSSAMLTGCGGGEDKKAEPAVNKVTMEEAISKYNLDPESDDFLDMSSDRLSEADLLVAYDKIKTISAFSMKYEEVVELFGVEPSRFRFDGTDRIFEWKTEESDSRYVRILFREQDGQWLNYIYSKTNM